MKITIDKQEKIIVTIDTGEKIFEKEYTNPVEVYSNMVEILPILLEN